MITGLIITLVIVGVVLWLINAYIPMQENIKKLLNIAVIVIMVVYVIGILLPMFRGLQLP